MTDLLSNAPTPAMQHALLPWESEETFAALHQGWRDHYGPQGPAEEGLIDQLVWIDWRRRRLVLAERALHMDSLDRRTSLRDDDGLSKRALVVTGACTTETASGRAIQGTDAEDAAQADEWRVCVEAVEIALALAGPDCGDLKAAESRLPDGTREWWEEHQEETSITEAERPAAFIRFLLSKVMPFFRAQRDAFEAGPAIRLQAWGESLDPIRMDRLLALDERLTRQYEKALGMLIRLREMRAKAVVSE